MFRSNSCDTRSGLSGRPNDSTNTREIADTGRSASNRNDIATTWACGPAFGAPPSLAGSGALVTLPHRSRRGHMHWDLVTFTVLTSSSTRWRRPMPTSPSTPPYTQAPLDPTRHRVVHPRWALAARVRVPLAAAGLPLSQPGRDAPYLSATGGHGSSGTRPVREGGGSALPPAVAPPSAPAGIAQGPAPEAPCSSKGKGQLHQLARLRELRAPCVQLGIAWGWHACLHPTALYARSSWRRQPLSYQPASPVPPLGH